METTVAELIEALEGYDPNAVVKIATQPGWPIEHNFSNVVEDQTGFVYLAASASAEYLAGPGREALGW